MTDQTPATCAIEYAWMEWRAMTSGVSGEISKTEFRRWLDAYDQDIRDTVKPPVIPDDCDYVWASVPDDRGERSIWTRTSDGRWASRMPRGNCTVQYPESDLIDPKPVPEEER